MNARASAVGSAVHTVQIFRADHVGSFLRPKVLLEARAQFQQGAITAEALRSVEDGAIREVVKFQEDLGFHVVTDGEYRRTFFHVDFLTQLAGVEQKGGLPVKFHKADGEIDYAPPALRVTGKVAHVKPIQLADFRFLKSASRVVPKVTIPSPTMLHFRTGRAGVPADVYPDMEKFFADVAAAYRAEIRSLADAGCTYLQLDDTNLAYLCDPKQREAAAARGDDPEALLHRYARLVNECLRDRPAGMTVGMHLCRGNFRSSWIAEGGYEPVAEALFNEYDIDTYLLEYDDARSGGFAPLKYLPRGKVVVLGLITTKLGELEPKDAVKRRIEEAAGFAPLEQLALSPQCGFSSTVHGNDVQVEQQAAKCRLVIEVAREVWGTD
ncbi:MAG TPA: 5-methyltetrahydropteroyltriglutamate--homocysteine S-methyltransferase [Steroidobacteraceae bacterium]|nr:5-methyltetrahydropteroyltriglutamate--homocysteine S-methyltransferase [Steroidobacteraceae bacterium]